VLNGHKNGVCKDEECDGVLEVLVLDQLVEIVVAASWLVNLDFESLALSYLLYLNPLALILCYKHIVEFLFFLDGLEVVDDDSHEQVNDELRTDNHESDEEQDADQHVRVVLRLQVNTS